MEAGVSAGTGAMGSVLDKLADLITGEYMQLSEVRKEVDFLERELRKMRAFLQTLADVEQLDPLAKDWKGDVRDLTYDLEDFIDRFIDRRDDKRGFIEEMLHRFRNLWSWWRNGTVPQIKELKARVEEQSARRDRWKLDESCKARTVEIDPRLATFYEEAKGLVGIDGPMEQVISWLVDQNMELKVVAILGAGGLGKTTLAMEVYRKFRNEFQCQASVSVSRTLDLDKLLKDLLSQIDKNEYEKCQEQQWGIEQLIPKLRKILSGKRYFIVIDDLWIEQDWKTIKAAFPRNDNRSRIIATTRITSLANACCCNSGDQLYKMAPLKDADAQRLFYKRIFCSDQFCPPQLETVSSRILKKCGGLPLAIITMASLLANKPKNKEEWERLQDSIGTGSSLDQDGNLKVMKDILLLSYWDLPHYLKTCLLYLCIYPEDNRISCKELKYKWIAEGFVSAQWGNLDQAAENYLNELVNRSMIQADNNNTYDSPIEFCRVHDMVLDLLISLSEEEKFATVLNGRVCNSLPSKIRRLSVQPSSQDHTWAVRAITESKLHLRSLNMFGKFEQIPKLESFDVLRVLDLHGQWGLENKDIKAIGSLYQLRYLRLDSSKITELPEEIGNLGNLETLDLRSCNAIEKMPSTVVQLQKLVRLFVHMYTMLPFFEFGSMQALEELSTVFQCDNLVKFMEELGRLRKLRTLSIWGSDDNAEQFLLVLRSSLSGLCKRNLRHLRVCGRHGDYLFNDPRVTFPHLHDLTLLDCCERVPRGLDYLKNLINLDITVEEFDEEGLNILMRMPSLAHLKLEVSDIRTQLSIDGNGFKSVNVFHYTKHPQGGGLGIVFAPGAMPGVRRFHLKLLTSGVVALGAAGFGLEHLSDLFHLQVEIDCENATNDGVEAVEKFIEDAIKFHPNIHNIQVHVHRTSVYGLSESEDEMESEEEQEGESSGEEDDYGMSEDEMESEEEQEEQEGESSGEEDEEQEGESSGEEDDYGMSEDEMESEEEQEGESSGEEADMSE